jgi:hypothetical protein
MHHPGVFAQVWGSCTRETAVSSIPSVTPKLNPPRSTTRGERASRSLSQPGARYGTPAPPIAAPRASGRVARTCPPTSAHSALELGLGGYRDERAHDRTCVTIEISPGSGRSISVGNLSYQSDYQIEGVFKVGGQTIANHHVSGKVPPIFGQPQNHH